MLLKSVRSELHLLFQVLKCVNICIVLEDGIVLWPSYIYVVLSYVLLQSILGNSSQTSILVTGTTKVYPEVPPTSPKKVPRKIEIPLNCSAGKFTRTCPANYYPSKYDIQDMDPLSVPSTSCPEYFRWIHEDLKPWRETGITEEMVERARRTATFRLVILDGRVYLETYHKAFQSRDTFTLWGILQLLRMYPGKVPDLDLMFDCVDWPVILSKFYRGPNATAPPPLFRYCADDSTLDIVFPDWSFWGWYALYILNLLGVDKNICILVYCILFL